MLDKVPAILIRLPPSTWSPTASSFRLEDVSLVRGASSFMRTMMILSYCIPLPRPFIPNSSSSSSRIISSSSLKLKLKLQPNTT